MEKSKGYKVVLNSCFGGFGLSKEAIKMLIDKHGLDIDSEYGYVDNEDFGIVDESHADRHAHPRRPSAEAAAVVAELENWWQAALRLLPAWPVAKRS